MPTAYPGDPTATQAPSPPPTPGAIPIANLPADSDPPNAATFAQAFKVAVDFIAWLMLPFAKIADWAKAIMVYRNARLQARFQIDHLGLPMGGNVLKWTEDWRGNDSQVGAGASAFDDTTTRWAATVVNTGSSGRTQVMNLSTLSGLPTPVKSRLLLLRAGTAVNDLSQVVHEYLGTFNDDVHLKVSMSVYPEVGGFAGQDNYAFGLGDNLGTESSMIGGVFEKKAGDTNWFAVVNDGTVATPPRVDTGVAVVVAGWQKLTVEWHGANVADDGVAAMRFYINDAPVATILSNNPTGAHLPSAAAVPRATIIAAIADFLGPQVVDCYVSPIEYAQNF